MIDWKYIFQIGIEKQRGQIKKVAEGSGSQKCGRKG